MESSLDTYQSILFLDLRPWQKANDSDLKYKQLILDTPKEYYTNQPFYEVDFIKPLSNIRKYYCNIIENEAIHFLNNLHAEVAASVNVNEKTYHVHFALTRMISQKLKETNQVIVSRNYSPEQFDLNQKTNPSSLAIANESYILHFLKHTLVRLVMDIQDSFKENLKEAALSEAEIYFKFFNESAPAKSYIIKAENYPNTKPVILSTSKTSKAPFNALKQDVRDKKKGIFTYESMIKNASRFAQIEEELYNNGIINENYQFADQHGQKQYLAAFYHQLIRKGYFNKRIFPENIENTALYIRKFLDNRYNTNVDKQFRNWDNDQSALLTFIEKDYWLDHITTC